MADEIRDHHQVRILEVQVMRIKRFIMSAAFVVCSSVAAAGPFGLEMGTKIGDLDAADSSFKPSLNSVPNPHPLFTNYSVWHSAETGVCRIMAISKFSENDRYGQDVRENFTRVKNALEKKYGSFKTVDVLKSGALWRDANEWVMSIRQNERTYAAVWEDVTDNVSGDSYSIIQLWVKALSSNTSMVVLEYRSVDFEQCNNSIESGQDSSF